MLEREDSTADLDWRRAKRVRLPNLQPSTTAISLRLPVSVLEKIKIAAANVPRFKASKQLKEAIN